MQTIYLLLTRSSTVLSRMVYLVTGDRYTHLSVSFEPGLQPLYSSSRKNGETLFPAGPCQERFDRGYLSRHPQTPCALYELQVSDAVYARARAETEAIMANAGRYSFNILGLILLRLNIPWHRPGHYFCSQMVSEILQNSGALALPKDPVLMRPMDYTRMPQLTCVYQGRLGELMHGGAAQPRIRGVYERYPTKLLSAG